MLKISKGSLSKKPSMLGARTLMSRLECLLEVKTLTKHLLLYLSLLSKSIIKVKASSRMIWILITSTYQVFPLIKCLKCKRLGSCSKETLMTIPLFRPAANNKGKKSTILSTKPLLAMMCTLKISSEKSSNSVPKKEMTSCTRSWKFKKETSL